MQEEKIRFHISGMTCQACARRIEKVLSKKPAILEAAVNFAGEEAQIRYDAGQTTAEEISQWISKTGYQPAQIRADDIPNPQDAGQESHWRLWLTLICALPFILSMAAMLAGRHWELPLIVQFILASIVQLWLAIPFYKGAAASIKGGLANMDVLVSFGTGTVYLYCAVVYLFGLAGRYPLYFDTGVMVISFVSLGKYLENKSKHTAINSLGELLSLTPDTAEKRTETGWQQVPYDSIQTGDTLRVSHGGKIAADGTVTAGEIRCDESHLTGEPMPVKKTAGSKVLAGSPVTAGSAEYTADTLGKNTLLGGMIKALAEAQGSKAPIARLADKAAGIFVPVAAGIALLTFVLTWLITGSPVRGLIHAAAVLVIACPCAMGLATPAAVMAGMGVAVKHGIWFKNAAALERTGSIDTAVFDKTGTLTAGRPQITAVHTFGSYHAATLMPLVSLAESRTTHPLAQAITSAYPPADRAISSITTHEGQGISAHIQDIGEITIGSPAFTGISAPAGSPWDTASQAGILINGEPAGIIAIADTLKPDSAAAITRLHNMGIRTIILSGDRQNAVDAIAAQLGIDEAKGGLSPREKAAYIQELNSQGRHTAMIGDGINDAPALAAANISFAMKSGAQTAAETADAQLMQNSISQFADAAEIARASMKNIKQNLFFAFFYNCLGIPLAAAGLLSPVIAGAAMALSSLSVLGNAMRLKRFTPQRRQIP